MKKGFLAASALLAGIIAFTPDYARADIDSPTVTITGFITYNAYGSGDVLILVSGVTAGCERGFWLRPADAGFKNLYAAALTLYTSKNSLIVQTDNTTVWPGSPQSGQTFCLVTALIAQ
jgi:hypothetical protein